MLKEIKEDLERIKATNKELVDLTKKEIKNNKSRAIKNGVKGGAIWTAIYTFFKFIIVKLIAVFS